MWKQNFNDKVKSVVMRKDCELINRNITKFSLYETQKQYDFFLQENNLPVTNKVSMQINVI